MTKKFLQVHLFINNARISANNDVFIQACRGSDHEIGVEPAVESDSYGGDQTDAGPISEYRTNDGRTIYVDTGCSQTLPSGSDFLFCYSVAKGLLTILGIIGQNMYLSILVGLGLDIAAAN